MYNHLRGTLAALAPSRAVLDVNGVGYDITLPLSATRRLPRVGEEATLLVHLVVREDELKLIGFVEAAERELFRRLINLSGVGPAMALQILSGMTPQEFAQAVERQDAGALKKVKGVGEKTAKRIILELKGAKTVLPAGDEGSVHQGDAADAVAALMALGLSQNEASARVDKALADQPGLGVEDLIKAALR